MTHSNNATTLIASFEGLRLKAYQDQNGVWTIGYGHTLGVVPNMVITEDDAKRFLSNDLLQADHTLQKTVKVPLTQNQVDAMISFIFNIGSQNFLHSSVLRDLNSKLYNEAANALLLWVHTGSKVNPGLVRRREAEKALFLKT